MTDFKEIDALYENNKVEDCYAKTESRFEALSPGNRTSDILWRMARVCRMKSKVVTDKTQEKELIYRGYDLSQKCLQVDQKNADCHKWFAIFLDLVGRYEGTDARIKNTYKVKESLELADKYRPKDPGTLHSLGVWHYEVTALPYWQRKLASYIFSTPPNSTYDIAADYFSKAETLRPNFYVGNLLYLCKSHKALKRLDSAKKYCQSVIDYSALKDAETIEAQKEASKLLKSL